MAQYLEDDSGVGISTPTGTGGVNFLSPKYIRVAWDFPANAPDPISFEIIVYAGTNPNDETSYLFPMFSVNGSERVWIKSTFFSGTETLNAAVRAVYYKG